MKKIIFVAFLLFMFKITNSQSRKENDSKIQVNTLFSVTESDIKSTEIQFKKKPIVDINSKLVIELNPDKITSRLADDKKSDPKMVAKTNALIEILKNQKELLELLSEFNRSNYKRDSTKEKKYKVYMNEFYEKANKNNEIRASIINLINEYDAKVDNNSLDRVFYPNTESYLIKNLSSITESLVDSIKNIKGVNKVQIQLAAFINTKKEYSKKVHIENFDNYSIGDYFEIPRYVTTFSKDDINAFNKISKFSIEINKLIEKKVFDLKNIFQNDTSEAYKNLNNFNQDFESLNQKIIETTVKEYFSKAKNQINEVYIAMRDFKELQNNTNGTNILEEFNTVSKNFNKLAKSLPNYINDIKVANLKDLLEKDPVANNLNSKLDKCITDIKNFSDLVSYISSEYQPYQSTVNSVQQLTGNLFSLSLNQLPTKGYIDLKTTGVRENGDELVIKLISIRKDELGKDIAQTIDAVTLELHQTDFYSESNISIILASPIGVSDDVKLQKNKFQFAPSASLLLKYGYKHRFWNKVSPGLGLVIATPDFNLDGTPEVSYGGILTLFNNVLSVGKAYNTKTNSPFWFFGVSIPLFNIGLPFGGNVQTQRNF